MQVLWGYIPRKIIRGITHTNANKKIMTEER